jgi:hypothetical protein
VKRAFDCARELLRPGVMGAALVASLFLLSAAPRALAQEVNPRVVEAFKRDVTAKMCQDGGEWLRCYQVDPMRCESLSAALVEPCVGEEILSKPAALKDTSNAASLANGLYSCLRTRFLAKYGADRLHTEECEGIE